MAVVIISIGLPLIGVRVFHGADVILGADPWRSVVATDSGVLRPPIGDTVDVVLPSRAAFADAAQDGRLALWNPYVSGGTPLGSVPDVGMLSPLNLPYILFPIWMAPAYTKLLELAVAIGFMYLFLRRLGLSKPSALFAGLAFAYSAFQIVWTNWPHPHVAALIPALFWATERHLQLLTRRSVLPIAVVTAVMLLEGFPSVLGYALLALGPYAVVRTIVHLRDSARRKLLALAQVGGGVILGAALSAVQLLPFAMQLSQIGLSARTQHPGLHLHPSLLLTSIIPHAFGSGTRGDYFATLNFIEAQSFIGVTVVVLAIIGIGARKRPAGAYGVWTVIAGSTVVSLVLAYRGGILLQLFQRLPVFESNFVGRLRSLIGFLVAILAAFGFESLINREKATDKVRRLKLLIVTGGALIVFAALLTRVARDMSARGATDELLSAVRVPLVVFVFLAIALVLRRIKPTSSLSTAALMVIPVTFAVEALAVTLPFWPRVPREHFYPSTPTHDFLTASVGHDRVVSDSLTFYPGTNTFYGVRTPTGHAFTSRPWKDLLLAVDPGALLSPTFSVVRFAVARTDSPILDRMAARYLVMPLTVPVLGMEEPVSAPSGTYELKNGAAVDVPMEGGPLRGVTLFVDAPAEISDRWARLEVAIQAPTGPPLVRSYRRLFERVEPGPFQIAVAGEALPAGPLIARISLRAESATELQLASATVTPLIRLIRPATDGLRLAHSGSAVTYERLTSLPRIRWAGRSQVIQDADERLAALADGVDPSVVVLDAPGPPANGASASVSVVRDDGNSVHVVVDARGDGYLVIADAMQHGWRARLDGSPVPLHGADHAMVAVAVPPGRHEVQVVYDPPGRKLGIGISLAATCLVIALALLGRRNENQSIGSEG